MKIGICWKMQVALQKPMSISFPGRIPMNKNTEKMHSSGYDYDALWCRRNKGAPSLT